MLTELDKSILLATAAGFMSGLFQSSLEHILQIKVDKKTITFNKIINRCLFSGFASAILFGVMIFALAAWDTTMSTPELNRYSIALAVGLGFTPIFNKFLEFVFSLFKSSTSNI